MSPISHPSAGSVRPVAWSGALALLLVAADAGAAGVVLRLDRTLSVRPPVALDEGTAILLRFGSSEIEQQIRLTRERIARLERTNQELEAAIGSGDELTAVLRTLQGLQDQVQEGVRKAMDASAAATARSPTETPAAQSAASVTAVPATEGTAQRAGVPVTQSVPRPAEAPAAQGTAQRTATPAADSSTRRTEAPAARTRVRVPAEADASSFEIPMAGLPLWVVGGVLGAIILALLGWMAVRVLARRKADGDPLQSDSWTAATDDVSRASAKPAGAAQGASAVDDATLDLDADLDVGSNASQADPVPAAGLQSERPSVESGDRWSKTMISRKAADPQALREVDTLIAFEQYDKAKSLLDEMMVTEPDDPELVLRHYHVRTQGGIDTTDDDEALLKAMMDGPLSDTMLRVRNLGRGLMPGDPLFDDPVKRAAASQVLKESKRSESRDEHSDDTVVQFTGTVKLDRSPLAGN